MKEYRVGKYTVKEWFGATKEWHTKEWHFNGKYHREDGPAIEFANGGKQWYLNGLLHRKDGPAIEWDNGSRYWYLNGKIHRVDGPAVEYVNGDKDWYLNDKLYTESDYHKKIEEMVKGSEVTFEEFMEEIR